MGIESSSKPLPAVLPREPEHDVTEETTENRKFSGEELSFLDFYFLLKAGEQKLRQVQSWNVKNHRSDAKCLPQIPKNTLLVHQAVMIPQVLLRRAL